MRGIAGRRRGSWQRDPSTARSACVDANSRCLTRRFAGGKKQTDPCDVHHRRMRCPPLPMDVTMCIEENCVLGTRKTANVSCRGLAMSHCSSSARVRRRESPRVLAYFMPRAWRACSRVQTRDDAGRGGARVRGCEGAGVQKKRPREAIASRGRLSLTHSPTHPLTHSRTHTLTHSRTHALTHHHARYCTEIACVTLLV